MWRFSMCTLRMTSMDRFLVLHHEISSLVTEFCFRCFAVIEKKCMYAMQFKVSCFISFLYFIEKKNEKLNGAFTVMAMHSFINSI